jgi:hypothetical protein
MSYMKINSILPIGLVLICLVSIVAPTMVQAQSPDGDWSDYVNISNTPTASTYPCIVADAQGYVHVLWSEDVGGITNSPILNVDGIPALDSRGNRINYLYNIGNTLFYSRWDGESWLEPIDVQVNSTGLVEYPRAAIDHKGLMHVVWGASQGQIVQIMYSQVPANKADLTTYWTQPVVLVEQTLAAYYPFDIAVDSKDGVHIFYSQLGEHPGAFVINSSDGGKTWSNPIQVYPVQDPTGTSEGVSTTGLVIDAKDRLHATWTRYDSSGNGKAIYYSQSTDLGETWSRPFEVAKWQPGWYETDWLSTGVVGDEIHLSWEGGKVAYQNERISNDGGQTWGENQIILPNLVGENGYANYVVDSSNQLHMFVVKRADPNSFAQGVWYTTWEQNHWADPVLLGTRNLLLYEKAGELTPESLQAITRGTFTGNGLRYQMSTIVNGNQIFVVVVNEYDGEIWSSHTTLNTPQIPPVSYPSLTAPSVLVPTSTGVVTTTQVTQTMDTPTPLLQPGQTAQAGEIQPSDILLFGVFPAAVIIIGIIIYTFRSKHG